MYNIIPPLLIVLGVAGLIVLLNSRNFKERLQKDGKKIKKGFSREYSLIFARWQQIFKKDNIDLLNSRVSNLSEKLLIRFRILILRTDQFLLKGLEKIRTKKEVIKEAQNGGGEKADFSELMPENQSASEEPEAPNPLPRIDPAEEEKKFLNDFLKSPQKEPSLINLARLYIFKKDFFSARWALLEAYRLNGENKIIQDLLLEVREKEMPA